MATRVAPPDGARAPAPGAQASLAPAPGRGTRLGRYELLCLLASGGMAQVWVAEQTGDLGFRKLVALKTILPEHASDSGFRSMFLDEAQLASRIRHANVVEILDLGSDGGILFQAMPLIEGLSLSLLLSRGRALPSPVAIRIVVDALRGLHAAHELCDDAGTRIGLVHRDVSPQNILVGVDGVAKLADFGIAKAYGRIAEETNTGMVKGKIRYLAPEQIDGLPPSPQSDLFSAGVVLWEALAGRKLFAVGNGREALDDRRRAPIADLRSVAPNVPARVAEVVMRSLARDPQQRFETARQMADALDASGQAPATHQDVAAVVETLADVEVRALREAIRGARSGGHSPARVEPVLRSSASFDEVDATTHALSTDRPPSRAPEAVASANAGADHRSRPRVGAWAWPLALVSGIGVAWMIFAARSGSTQPADEAPAPTAVPVAAIAPSPLPSAEPSAAAPPAMVSGSAAPPTSSARTAAPKGGTPRGVVGGRAARPASSTSVTAPEPSAHASPTTAQPPFESPYR